MEYLVYPLLGIVAGLLAGLLGVGGGIVTVPVLIFTFHWSGMSPAVLTHMAVATSLAIIFITSSGSAWQHNKKGAVRWDILSWMAVGLVMGALVGAEVANFLQGRMLQLLFGGFAILMAAQMAIGFEAKPGRGVPSGVVLWFGGLGTGVISALFGIGGGSMMVPFLVWCNVKMPEAVGTSSAGGIPIAVAGTTGFIITSWGDPDLPRYSLGYIYLPALFGVGFTSVIFAQVGARYAHKLPARTLKKIFALLLAIVGAKLLIG
jgi:uncharacterized membrane protein YfcA